MSFEDTIRNMDYVAGEIKKIRAVISAGDVNTALKLLVGLKNSFQLESLSDMTDMGAGTSLSYVLAVDIAEKFLRANNPVQAFQVLREIGLLPKFRMFLLSGFCLILRFSMQARAISKRPKIRLQVFQKVAAR